MLYSFTSFTITLPNKRKAGSSKWSKSWLGYMTVTMNALPYQVSLVERNDQIIAQISNNNWARNHGLHSALTPHELAAINYFISKYQRRIREVYNLQKEVYMHTYKELIKTYPFRAPITINIPPERT